MAYLPHVVTTWSLVVSLLSRRVAAQNTDAELNKWNSYNWDATVPISRSMGFLSMVGSLWIMVETAVLSKKCHATTKQYKRILFCLSFFDFFSSTFFFVGDWAFGSTKENDERDSTGWTQQTTPLCRASGFFIYCASIVNPLYNIFLAVYFLLTIQYGRTRGAVVVLRGYGKYVHGILCTIGVVPALTALAMDMYQPYYKFCYINASPEESRKEAAFLWFAWSSTLFSTMVVSLVMIKIYWHVRSTSRKSRAYSERNASIEYPVSNSAMCELSSDQLRRKEVPVVNSYGRRRRRSSQSAEDRQVRSPAILRKVRSMAFLYTIPFFLTWTFSTIFAVVGWSVDKKLQRSGYDSSVKPDWFTAGFVYTMNVWIATALPLQGFFNLLIYMYPRFQCAPFGTFRRACAKAAGGERAERGPLDVDMADKRDTGSRGNVSKQEHTPVSSVSSVDRAIDGLGDETGEDP